MTRNQHILPAAILAVGCLLAPTAEARLVDPATADVYVPPPAAFTDT
jgi:hypothetical protein